MAAKVIDLSPEEVLEANLRALGLDTAVVSANEDRVYEAFTRMTLERKRIVSQSEVAREIGLCQSAVSRLCLRLVESGRMLVLENHTRGKPCYVPKVV